MNLVVEHSRAFPNPGAELLLGLSDFTVSKRRRTFVTVCGSSAVERSVGVVLVSFSFVANMANLLRGDSKLPVAKRFFWGVESWELSSMAESDNRLKLND